MSPKTTSRRLTSIRAFARWAHLATPELLEYSAPSAGNSIPHPIPEGMEGVRAMIECANMDHHAAYIALCGMVGLRTSESIAVTADHFDFETMLLSVRGKGDVTRKVPVSEEAWEILAPCVIRSAGHSTVVGLRDRYARRLATDLGERANLKRHVASHDLRATFATAVFDKTGDIRIVQMLLGHASVTTTQIYIERKLDLLKDAVAL